MPDIRDVRFTAASSRDRRAGLLGFVAVTLHCGIRLDGLTLRRTLDGDLALSFPSRLDRNGREHPYILPLGERAQRRFEDDVFSRLDLEAMR